MIKDSQKSLVEDDEERLLSNIMASFSCCPEIAKKIIKSAELNGQLEGIKNVCRNNGTQNRRF